jgi:hypothetical protein
VARASQLPALRLTGSIGFESVELGSLVSSGSRIWSVGAGLLGPILDGGRYAARTAQAEAQRGRRRRPTARRSRPPFARSRTRCPTCARPPRSRSTCRSA